MVLIQAKRLSELHTVFINLKLFILLTMIMLTNGLIFTLMLFSPVCPSLWCCSRSPRLKSVALAVKGLAAVVL